MNRPTNPRPELTWADYGIEVDEGAFKERDTIIERCPRCHQYRLVLGGKTRSFHCDGCYWSGKLQGGDADQGRGLVSLADAEPMLERWHSHGRPPALQSGLGELDEMYQPRRGEITVITGYPGDGKSTWLKWFLTRLAQRHSSLFAVFSPEDMPFHLYLGQMVVKAAGKQFDLLESRELKLAESWIRNHFVMLDPPDATAEGIIAQVKKNQADGFHGLVIDPWTEVEHNIPAGMREDQYLNKALTRMRRLARFLHIHIWIVVHPRSIDRVSKGNGKKEMPVPSMDDLAGGAMWKNKPDWGVTIHRPFKAQGTEDMWVDAHVQKARFSGFLGGFLGCVRMCYERSTGTYSVGDRVPPFPLDQHKERMNTASALKGYFDDPGWTWPPKDPSVLRPINWTKQDGGEGWWHEAGKLQAFVDAKGKEWRGTVRLKADVTSKRQVGPIADLGKVFDWAERTMMEWDVMADPREEGHQ